MTNLVQFPGLGLSFELSRVAFSPEGEAFFVLYILHKNYPSFLVSENDRN